MAVRHHKVKIKPSTLQRAVKDPENYCIMVWNNGLIISPQLDFLYDELRIRNQEDLVEVFVHRPEDGNRTIISLR